MLIRRLLVHAQVYPCLTFRSNAISSYTNEYKRSHVIARHEFSYPPTSVTMKSFIACAIGVLAHHLVFIHNEWHLRAPVVAVAHAVAAAAVLLVEVWCGGSGYGSYLDALLLISTYICSLFTSIIIYRLYFHQLCVFPGPRMAAASKLWHVWQCRDSRNHLVLEKLHQQFGSFVRTGAVLTWTQA